MKSCTLWDGIWTMPAPCSPSVHRGLQDNIALAKVGGRMVFFLWVKGQDRITEHNQCDFSRRSKRPQMVICRWEINGFLIKHSFFLNLNMKVKTFYYVSPGCIKIYLSPHAFMHIWGVILHYMGDSLEEGKSWKDPFFFPVGICSCQWHQLGFCALALLILTRLFRSLLFCDPLPHMPPAFPV